MGRLTHLSLCKSLLELIDGWLLHLLHIRVDIRSAVYLTRSLTSSRILTLISLLQVLQQIFHEWVQILLLLLLILLLKINRSPLRRLVLTTLDEVPTELVDVFALRLSDVWCSLLQLLLLMIERGCLHQIGNEGTLSARGLLCLDGTEVIATSMATMIDEVPMPERLLEVCARFRLKTATVLLSLAGARAGTCCDAVGVFLM